MPESNPPIKIDPELLSACIHCGLCLPACPTYLATSRETESPRGRIYLMNMLAKQELAEEETARAVEHLDSCLGCLGCQTACPSGVQYGKLLDQARPLVAEYRSPHARRVMRFAFSRLLPNYPLLRKLARLMRFAQQTRLDKLPDRLPWLRPLLGKLDRMRQFAPIVPPFKPLPRQSWAPGEKKGTVQFFAGCVMDVFYNHVNHACVRLLTNQKQVVQVPDQTCCGALAFHAGENDIARRLAKENIELFEGTSGPIVVSSAGCGAMLKEYGELIHEDPQWHQRAEQFSKRVCDITEFLADHEFSTPSQPVEKKVAYHAACHLAHAQNVRSQPVELLNRVQGVLPVPLEEAEHCCGSAGIYNLLHTELSMEVLDRKMENIEKTGADLLVTTNPGCLLQLQKGLADRHSPMEACHLIELLDRSFSSQE